jgi:hypothetical protein
LSFSFDKKKVFGSLTNQGLTKSKQQAYSHNVTLVTALALVNLHKETSSLILATIMFKVELVSGRMQAFRDAMAFF